MTYTIILFSKTQIFHTCCVYTRYCKISCFFSSQPIGHARMPLGLQTREMAMVRTILLLILCYIICAAPITVLFLLSCCDELFHEHGHQHDQHAFNSTHNTGHDHLGLVNFVMHLDANENEPHVHHHHFDHDGTCYYLVFFPYVLQFAMNFFVYAITNEQYRRAYKDYINHILGVAIFKDVAGSPTIRKMQQHQKRRRRRLRRFSDSCIANAVSQRKVAMEENNNLEDCRNDVEAGDLEYVDDEDEGGTAFLCTNCRIKHLVKINVQKDTLAFPPTPPTFHSEAMLDEPSTLYSYLSKRRYSF